MSDRVEWTPEQERAVYTARAQAIIEALVDYESAHTSNAPCLHDALRVAVEVLGP